MCRLNRVTKARQAQGKCGRCGAAIEAGDAYRWWKGRYTRRNVRCMRSSCTPQPWELETNPLKAEAMQGEDAHANATSMTSDAASAASYLREAIDVATSVSEQLQERIDNKSGSGFEQSSEVDALSQSQYDFEEYVSEAETIADDLEQLDTPPEESQFDAADYQSESDPAAAAEDAYEDAVAEYENDVQEALDRLPDWPELDLGQYGPPRPKRKPKTPALI